MSARELPPIGLPTSRRGEWVFGAVLPGEPQRSAKKPGFRGRRVTMVPDPKWEAWRDWATLVLQGLWRGRAPVHFPVLGQVVAVFSRPLKPRKTYTAAGVSHPYPWPWTDERIPYIGVPDADQLQKAGFDVAKRAGILVDDWLVEPLGTPRYYAAAGEEARVEIRFWRSL